MLAGSVGAPSKRQLALSAPFMESPVITRVSLEPVFLICRVTRS